MPIDPEERALERSRKKVACPISKARFHRRAQPMLVDVGAGRAKLVVGARTHASGALGWYGNKKAYIEIDGVPCKCQMSVTITLIASQDAPSGEEDK